MSVTYILNIDNGMTLFFVLWSTFICGKHLLHQCKVKCYAFISFEVRSKVSEMTGLGMYAMLMAQFYWQFLNNYTGQVLKSL